MIITYARGSSLAPEIRSQDSRFSYDGKPSATALRRYWRLLSDGRPDPECKAYRAIWEIDLHHKADTSLGENRIQTNPVGRPKAEKRDRSEYQRNYWLNRKEKLKQGKSNDVI